MVTAIEDNVRIERLENLAAHLGSRFSTDVQKRTLHVVFGQLAAGVVNGAPVAIPITADLPAGSQILGVGIRLPTRFTGAGFVSVGVDIGTAGDPNAIVANSDVSDAGINGQASTLPAGIAPHPKYVAATTLFATFTPDGGHALVNLAQGECFIDLEFAQVPPL